MHQHANDPFRVQVRRYDLVLTYGGGPPVIDAYRSFGARQCVPIYNALDPETHFPSAPVPRFTGLLGFLGNRLPDREARVREFFLAPAARMPDQRFVMGGSGWDKNVEMSANVCNVGHVYTRDHNAFNCSTLAVLNVNRDSMARTGYSPPTRVFEAAGAGACLICDAWEGLEEFLEPGREVLRASSGDEVVALLRGLTPEIARRIGERARQRLLGEHTYSHRAQTVQRLLIDDPVASNTFVRRAEEQPSAPF
jgi:spore maturation protein CgeB